MKKWLVFSMAPVLVLALASAGHASETHFLVSGSVSQTGTAPQWGPTGNFYSWSGTAAEADAVDVVADGASVMDSALLEQTWGIGWLPAAGNQTIYTVDYSIDSSLFTEIANDWASGDVTVTLAIQGTDAISQATYTPSVMDGETLSEVVTGSIAVATPTGLVGGQNGGTLALTVAVNAEAFKAEGGTPPPPPPEPTVPAPGAIVLGSLGVGFVGWLRRRHSL